MTGMTAVAPSPRVFRGWWVLAGVFLIMTTGSGFAFYAQGVFLEALVQEQGFSVGMAGAGTGLFFVVSGVAGYYAGGLISRFDIRAVMVAGATMASIGIVLLGLIRTEWQMFAVFVIYGAGYAFTGLVPGTSLVTRWFHVRRSVALSIASTGLSVGGIAITPIIAKLIDARSLVEIAPQLAVAYWIGIVVPTLLLLRPSPESVGLRPDGAAKLPVGSAPETVPGVDFAVAVRTRFFMFLSAGFILVMGAQVGAIQHLFKLVKDGFGVDVANLVLILIAFMSVLARLAGGVAATRVPIRLLATTLVLVQAVGISTIGLAEERWMIFVGVVILGTAMGNLLMLHPLILADAFGVRDYPRIYGLGSLLMVTGVGLGPFVVGIIRDLASYQEAFLTMSAVAIAGFVVVRMAGAPDRAWAEELVVDVAPEMASAGPPVDDRFEGAEVFAAVTRDVHPVGVGGAHRRDDLVDEWNPDPAWLAPDLASNQLATSAAGDGSRNGSTGQDRDGDRPRRLPPSRLGEPDSSNGATGDDVRFRRPPTILPVTAESDVADLVVRRTRPPMPDSVRSERLPAVSERPSPSTADGRPPSVSRPPSVVGFESGADEEHGSPGLHTQPAAEQISLEDPLPIAEPLARPEPAVEPVAEPTPEPVAQPAPAPEPEPVTQPQPVAQPVPAPEPEPTPEPVAQPVAESQPEPQASPVEAFDVGSPSAEKPAETSRFAMPMAIASTTVAVVLMAWVRWISRSGGEGPGGSGS